MLNETIRSQKEKRWYSDSASEAPAVTKSGGAVAVGSEGEAGGGWGVAACWTVLS